MAEKPNNWSRAQLLIAFNLYCQIPFGRLHSKNPDIVRFATLIGRTASALAMKLTNIASLDPEITSSGRSGLAGASAADKAMWDEMQQDWENFALESQAAVDALLDGIRRVVEPPGSETLSAMEDGPDYGAENKLVQAQIRMGQQFFRRSVISAYRGRCCVTGLTESRLLVASHIVPWRADKHNRLNPRNGLCLSALHDKAFDQGFFTLTNDFRVETSREAGKLASNRFAADWLLNLDGQLIELPEKFQPAREFLEWHRANVFLDSGLKPIA